MNTGSGIFGLFFVLLLADLPVSTTGQTIRPFSYWRFDDDAVQKDIIGGRVLDTTYYRCGYTVSKGLAGNAINVNNASCPVLTKVLHANITDEFTIEFLFKGEKFTFLTLTQQNLIVQFSYPRILFRTTTVSGEAKPVTDSWVIELKGAGRQSYNYYADGNWHHLVFTASLKTGKKEVWVDGECPDGFSKTMDKAERFVFGTSDGFRNTSQIDELAFYNAVLPPPLIRQHYDEVNRGLSYSFNVKKSKAAVAKSTASAQQKWDPLEFAPGFPDYTLQATDQLKAFPLPRYNNSAPAKRNMSWMDINFLHRELPGKGGKGFGAVSSSKAVELTAEMAEHWNYYIDLPTLRTSAETADASYRNNNSVPGALADFANRHPQYPYATILIEAQNRPVHAGLESSKAFVTAQNLPLHYYLRDGRGQPVIQSNRKWLSPLMPMDIMQKDGKTSRFYLNQLLKHVHRPPALINENGEVFGHIRSEVLLKQDPAVWVHYKKSDLSASQYSGWFQHRMDSVYRAAVMEGLSAVHTHFSFYNIAAFNPAYWPDYAMRRELNRWDAQTVYPTPDFYPRWPDNWQNARGAYNGYGTVAMGRVKEIALGDRFFTPFVAAGWGAEESNIRPAQWLALLKTMVMLGADFFYTGYFNVTGSGGKWANGAGPNDPRGYAYQIAMPVYAQALRSWIPGFFDQGELLNPADPNDLTHQFRFHTGMENELVLVRKWGNRYLICGSLQPNSNIKGNVPQSKITTITLDGSPVTFEIRRQGSLYVLDKTEEPLVFYQLDGWHQYEHPWYWNKAVVQEAEVYSSKQGEVQKVTDRKDKGGDFSAFTTYVTLGNKSLLHYAFACPPETNTLTIRARSRSAGAQRTLRYSVNGLTKTIVVSGSQWKEYKVPVKTDTNCTVELFAETAGVQIDNLTLSASE